MYLKELSIHGFKSFAKKSELEFTSAITAIVGPNGSGKSNVAESFRFVLGEQSVKAMRGKKGEDLIWGGSEKVSRGNRASVEVTFDNTQKTFALDFDEVKIERIVHRDGQNEYKLNGTTVRLKDVHELLAGANIGSTGHHIISQGEADRILASNARERREMIEDALGLKVFQLKKQEAERKLDKTHENIEQVQSLRREAAPHLRYLKKQVEQAERSLEVQKQLKSLYAEYLKREDTYIAHHHDRLIKAGKAPAEELEAVEKELAVAEEKIKAETENVLREEISAAEQEVRTARSERQLAEIEHSKLVGQASFLESRLAQQSEKSTEEVLLRKSEFEAMYNGLKESAETALNNKDSHQIANSLQKLIHDIDQFIKKHATISPQDSSKEDKKELESLAAAAEKAKATLEKATANLEAAEENLKKLHTAKEESLQANREAERALYEFREKRRGLQAKLSNLDHELATLERDRSLFKQELQEAVSLIGRGASDYFNFEIKEGEQAVGIEGIVSEEREKQRARHRELEKLKIRLEELGIGATDEVLKEYENAKDRDEFLARELADLEESVKNLKKLITDLQTQLEEQFVDGIEKISLEFNRFFTLMFGGGSATLQQVKIPVRKQDDDEGETEVQYGVELDVSLPNKRVKGLEMLSGGERALTSIAVIFAMSQVNPPPFIILDETDAALDEANSRRYGDMIEELAKKSQLVLITHNRETMSRAGILYGITMGVDGVSKVLSVKFDEAAAVAK